MTTALLWVYAIADVAPQRPWWVVVGGATALALVTFACGLVLGWWSLLCVLLLVLAAIPAGGLDSDTEDHIPVVVVALYAWVPLSLLILGAAGVTRSVHAAGVRSKH